MAPVPEVEQEVGKEEEKEEDSRSLSREDCLCPICLEIFIEPVTLPCTHTFCKVCFLESVDKATLCCPLCRRRVAVWARHHSRTKSLVNEALWRRIQTSFPRGSNQETNWEPVLCPRLSEPGALRQEYEDQISKLTEQEEQQCRASEELIQKLLEEDEQLHRQQQQRHLEDEKLAWLLSRELNSVPDSEQSRTPEVALKKKLTMDRFLLPVSRSPAHSSVSNKENVHAPSDLPLLEYYGPHTGQSEPAELHIGQSEPAELHTGQSEPAELHTGQSEPAELHTGQSEPAELHTGQSEPAELHTGQSEPAELHTGQSEPSEPQAAEMDQSQLWYRPAEGGTKRKSQEAASHSKRSCALGVAIEWEAELQRRRRQEEEDLAVALELQRQFDRRPPTDRRKGTADAYHLRTTRRGRASATETATRTTASTTGTTSATETATGKETATRTAATGIATATRTIASTTGTTSATETATGTTTRTAVTETTAATMDATDRGTATETATATRTTAATRTATTGTTAATRTATTGTTAATRTATGTSASGTITPLKTTVPPTPRTKRQTTLTDLFNLRS